MSHGTCPTVRIAEKNEQGFIIINESDYDPEKHTLFVESEAEKPKPLTKKEQKDLEAATVAAAERAAAEAKAAVAAQQTATIVANTQTPAAPAAAPAAAPWLQQNPAA